MTHELKHKKVNFAMVGCSEMYENSHTFHHVLDFANITKIRKINRTLLIILVYFPIQPSLLQGCADLKRNLVVKSTIPSHLSLEWQNQGKKACKGSCQKTSFSCILFHIHVRRSPS